MGVGMLGNMLKQKNIPILGALTDALYTAMPAVSLINFVSILIVLYETLRKYIADYLPWLTFWIFLGGIVALSVIILVLTYKFVIPSLWTFRNNQMNVYDSVVVDKLNALTEEVRALKSKQKIE